MFQHIRTIITNSEFNIPESGDKISGSCSASAAIGIPKDFSTNKFVRCKVDVKATNSESDLDLLRITSISEFAVTDDNVSEDILKDRAFKDCIPIALSETAEKIAAATEILCGRRIELPINDDLE